MGDPQNITEETLINLATALGMDLNEVKIMLFQSLEKQRESEYKEIAGEDPNITEIFEKAAKAWGQSVEEARKYTYELLKYEVKKMNIKK